MKRSRSDFNPNTLETSEKLDDDFLDEHYYNGIHNGGSCTIPSEKYIGNKGMPVGKGAFKYVFDLCDRSTEQCDKILKISKNLGKKLPKNYFEDVEEYYKINECNSYFNIKKDNMKALEMFDTEKIDYEKIFERKFKTLGDLLATCSFVDANGSLDYKDDPAVSNIAYKCKDGQDQSRLRVVCEKLHTTFFTLFYRLMFQYEKKKADPEKEKNLFVIAVVLVMMCARVMARLRNARLVHHDLHGGNIMFKKSGGEVINIIKKNTSSLITTIKRWYDLASGPDSHSLESFGICFDNPPGKSSVNALDKLMEEVGIKIIDFDTISVLEHNTPLSYVSDIFVFYFITLLDTSINKFYSPKLFDVLQRILFFDSEAFVSDVLLPFMTENPNINKNIDSFSFSRRDAYVDDDCELEDQECVDKAQQQKIKIKKENPRSLEDSETLSNEKGDFKTGIKKNMSEFIEKRKKK